MEGSGNRNEKAIEDALIAIFVIWLILQLFAALPSFLSNTLGIDEAFLASTFGIRPSLTADTPLGTAVINENDAEVYSEPGGGELLNVQPKGAQGIVVGGPVLQDGELWWQVLYDDGTIGWVRNSDLAVDVERDQRLLKENTPHGTKVEQTQGTQVYSTPDEDGLVVGFVPEGAKGTIIGGPVERDGERWWQVRYEDGTSGWVPESSLQIDVERNNAGVNDGTPLGTAIEAVRDLDVWNAPRLGQIIGNQIAGARGVLVDGSVTVGTQRWWQVDFENDPDGWVLESDIQREFPLKEAASGTLQVLKRISYTISLVFLIVLIYIFVQLRHTLAQEYHRFKPLSTTPEEQQVKNSRWERVLQHVASDNPNDWRLAILEADIILADVVESMYLPGDTLGERLKAVERSDFETIDQAWEAHKMRNRLAHEGSDYILTQREAKRIVDLYRQVFEEFHAI